ncbi:MAG: ribbon-helix-helix domain-containing protein [Rhodospirillaceae bacterium]|nr:ribbon-helix-helix domain-containing protein [Rhodospirillaceae bacterium]
MATKVLTAHVPLPLAKKIDKLAEQMERSRGWIVKEALTDWIEREERRHQMTLEALAAVDAGDIYDHRDVVAWAKSLGTKNPLPLPTRRARR